MNNTFDRADRTPLVEPRVPRSEFFSRKLKLGGAAALLLLMTVALAAINIITTKTGWEMPLWISGAFEVAFLLLPCMLVFAFSVAKPPSSKLSPLRVALVFGLAITGFFFAGIATSGWTLVWTYLTSGTAATPGLEFAGYSYLELMFFVAIVPAVCEELFFRGILLKSMSRNPIAGLVISSALFALLHMDMTKLFATFALGMFIGWVVLRTGNVIYGMILHFVNNLIAVTVLYFMSKYYDALMYYAENPQFVPPEVTRIMGIASLLFLLLLPLSALIFFLILGRLRRDTETDAAIIHMTSDRLLLGFGTERELAENRRPSFGAELLLSVSAMVMIFVALWQTGIFFQW